MARPTFISIMLLALVIATSAFSPSTPINNSLVNAKATMPKTIVNMGFGLNDEEQPKKLTRENEPEEYFSSEMDQMSDAEKLPIALGGLAFVSLPFIAGLIALYSSK